MLATALAIVLGLSSLQAQSNKKQAYEPRQYYEFARVYVMNTQFFASNEIEEGTAIYSTGNYEDLTGQTIDQMLNQFSNDGWQMVNASRGGGDSYRAEFFYFQRPIKD